jgi:hypothetical protein
LALAFTIKKIDGRDKIWMCFDWNLIAEYKNCCSGMTFERGLERRLDPLSPLVFCDKKN